MYLIMLDTSLSMAISSTIKYKGELQSMSYLKYNWCFSVLVFYIGDYVGSPVDADRCLDSSS
jgi:hypothetical protein